MTQKLKINITADCFAADGRFFPRGKTQEVDADCARELCNSGRANYVPAESAKKPKANKAKKSKTPDA